MELLHVVQSSKSKLLGMLEPNFYKPDVFLVDQLTEWSNEGPVYNMEQTNTLFWQILYRK